MEEIPFVGHKPEEGPKTIKTETEFWAAFTDARNQFMYIQLQFNLGKSEGELKGENKKENYLSLKDYLKGRNCTLSQEIQSNENAQHIIGIYNDIIERIKNFRTKNELEQILKEVKEFLNPFSLGLKK